MGLLLWMKYSDFYKKKSVINF